MIEDIIHNYSCSAHTSYYGITGTVRQSLEYLPSGDVFRAENYPEQIFKNY